MLSIFLSFVAFFVAGYYIKRHLDDMGIPKSMTRSVVVLLAASLISYGVAWIVDRIESGSADSGAQGKIDLQDLLRK